MKSLDLPFGVDFVLLDGEEFIFRNRTLLPRLGAFRAEYAAGRLPGHYRCGVLLDMVGDAKLQIYQEKYERFLGGHAAAGRFDLGDRGAAGRAGIHPAGRNTKSATTTCRCTTSAGFRSAT